MLQFSPGDNALCIMPDHERQHEICTIVRAFEPGKNYMGFKPRLPSYQVRFKTQPNVLYGFHQYHLKAVEKSNNRKLQGKL